MIKLSTWPFFFINLFYGKLQKHQKYSNIGKDNNEKNNYLPVDTLNTFKYS